MKTPFLHPTTSDIKKCRNGAKDFNSKAFHNYQLIVINLELSYIKTISSKETSRNAVTFPSLRPTKASNHSSYVLQTIFKSISIKPSMQNIFKSISWHRIISLAVLQTEAILPLNRLNLSQLPILICDFVFAFTFSFFPD